VDTIFRTEMLTNECIGQCQGVHHHHHTEETYLFPKYNEKLGANAMDQNVEQHHAFLDGLNDLESYFKEVHAGTTPYNGAIVIQKIDGFADDLVLHLNEVRCNFLYILAFTYLLQEIATLESSRMRAALTAEDLKDIEDTVKKIVLKNISFFKGLPMGLVCHDKSSAPQYASKVLEKSFPVLTMMNQLATSAQGSYMGYAIWFQVATQRCLGVRPLRCLWQY
jgi:hypothetical protein